MNEILVVFLRPRAELIAHRWADTGDTVTLVTRDRMSLIQPSNVSLPVIVAEIGAQSVDIQDQSHGAAQQFCKHFSVSQTRGGKQQ